MKKILFTLLTFCFLSINAYAQITLNRSDFGMTGTQNDTTLLKACNTVGVARPTYGNNQVWDYTNLRDSIPTVYQIVSTLANSFGTSLPAPFASATYAYQGFGGIAPSLLFPVFRFEKIDNTGYYSMGYAHNSAKFPIGTVTGGASDTLEFLASLRVFANYLEKFPMTANSTWKIADRDTSNFRLTVRAFGLNQTPGNRVSVTNAKDTIVGWGTLRLRNPAGGNPLNFAVLLREKTGGSVDSFFLGGAPAPAALLQAFGLTQGRISTYNTQLDFLGVGYKYSLVSFYISPNNQLFYIQRGVLPNIGLTVSNADIRADEITVKTFPNPATEGVFFEFDKSTAADWNIMIYNTAGQIVTMQPVSTGIGATTVKILLSENLAMGNYFYNIIDENSLIRAKGQFLKR